MKHYRVILIAVTAVLMAVGVSGCQWFSKSSEISHGAALANPIADAATAYTGVPLDLSQVKPNEAGDIPVLEYHQLVPDGVRAHGYQYPASMFKSDMERLYELGYRPINLSELVTGRIDCPAGKSPVVLTFDDALPGQIDYDASGRITPQCAVGILEQMHAEHADWPLRATFFVLPRKGRTDYFYQAQYSRQKLQWLVANGFELGNHTVHHLPGIKDWPDSRVESEFAIAARMIDENVPNYKVDLLALPFGVYPRHISLVERGCYEGLRYDNICAMLAGAAPAPSPVTRAWNPFRIQRIIPGNARFEIGWWLNYLEAHKVRRYVSDGDPNTVTVPTMLESTIDEARVQKLGLHVRTY